MIRKVPFRSFRIPLVLEFQSQSERKASLEERFQRQEKRWNAVFPDLSEWAFARLSKDQQLEIQNSYNRDFEHYKAKNFPECLRELDSIFKQVPDFKNAREMEAFAIEGRRIEPGSPAFFT